MTTWKRNLVLVWFSQFFSMSGFSLALPFAPFYIQHLGVTDPNQVKFWSSLSTSSVAFAIAIVAPIWGGLADRYGRKIMLLRANFCATAILLAMGFSPNVYAFVILRFLQGMFTGTINAAMTMVSSGTPNDRQGFALGTLSTGVFAGNFFGPMVGGFLAEEIGYRNTFVLSAIFLLIAGVIVTIGVKEDFTRPEKIYKVRSGSRKSRLAGLGPGMPILVLILLMNMARTFDQPILPLFIQEIHGKLEGASRLTGLINGISAIGAMLAGVILGRLADRMPPHLIGKFSAVGAGVFMGLMGIFPVFAMIFPARFMMSFCSGGLDPVFMVWLSKATPPEKRGTIFGWAVTARSIGWGIAPAISGGIAVAIGLRPVFIAGMILYFILVPVIHNVSQSFDVKKV